MTMHQPVATPVDELHIASLVVHSTPKRAARVGEAVAELPGAQVHAISETGKLVVTLEAPGADPMLELIGRIQRTDGVLSAAVVYQCADTLDAMNQEMPDGPRTT